MADEKTIMSIINRLSELESQVELLKKDYEKFKTVSEGRFRFSRKRVNSIAIWVKKMAKMVKIQLPYILDQTGENKRIKNAKIEINGEGE